MNRTNVSPERTFVTPGARDLRDEMQQLGERAQLVHSDRSDSRRACAALVDGRVTDLDRVLGRDACPFQREPQQLGPVRRLAAECALALREEMREPEAL